MRELMRILSTGAPLLIVVGIVNAALAIVGSYMVVFGHVTPGEPMYLDELAPTLGEAMGQATIGVALIALGFLVRAWAKVASEKPPHNTTINPDASQASRRLH
jgi:hypothetical protein